MNIVWRETWRGRVWRAVACRLVEERGDLLVLWHPAGTPGWIPYARDGRKLRIPGEEDWELREARAPGASLGLIRLGRRWSSGTSATRTVRSRTGTSTSSATRDGRRWVST